MIEVIQIAAASDALENAPGQNEFTYADQAARSVRVVALRPLERCESGRIGLTANELTW